MLKQRKFKTFEKAQHKKKRERDEMMDDGAFEDEEEEFDDDDERYVPTLQQTLSKLRSRRDAARENKHGLRSSALFFAENCCVMSSALVKFVVKKKKKKKMKMKNEDEEETHDFATTTLTTFEREKKSDVYAFASILHEDGQHARAMEIMKKKKGERGGNKEEENYLDEFGEMSVLASRCLYKSRKFEECLKMCELDGLVDFGGQSSNHAFTGDVVGANHVGTPSVYNNNNSVLNGDDEDGRDLVAMKQDDGLDQLRAISAHVRGKVHDQLDARNASARWFQISLILDPMLYDSYEALTKSHALPMKKEKEVVQSLRFEEGDEWMRAMYDAIAGRFEEDDFGAALRDSTNTFSTRGGGGRRGDRLRSAATPPVKGSPAKTLSPSRRSPRKKTQMQSQQHNQSTPVSGVTTGTTTSFSSPELEILRDAPFLRAKRAEWLYNRGETRKCFEEMQRIAAKSSAPSRFDVESLPAYLASAVDLKKSNDLYKIAHDLTALYPKHAISWYAVGCYYLVAKRFDDARRYFGKSTVADQAFAPAWIAFGHAFAMQDESDQAVAAYRTASRLFPGMHVPVLCAGMEYSRGSNNASFARSFFEKAAELNPTDALVQNELGVSAYKRKEYLEAEQFLRDALWLATGGGSSTSISTSPSPQHATVKSEEHDVVALASRLSSQKLERWEPCVVNLAHCLRKLKRFEESIACYEQAIALRPNISSTHSALGFAYQMKANFLDVTSLENAVASYHKALGLNPLCEFSQEMLELCLIDIAAVKLPRYVPHDEYDDNPIDLRDLNTREGGFEMYDQDEDDEEMEE